MKNQRTPISTRKGIKISDRTRELYKKRDKRLDQDPDSRPLPPEKWTQALRRSEFFRPTKKPITTLVDADVLHWLKSEGAGYQSRINIILREAMEKAAQE